MNTAIMGLFLVLLNLTTLHAQTNLVVNGDFEAAIEPWKGNPTAGISIAHETKDTAERSAGALKVTIKRDAGSSQKFLSHGAGVACSLTEALPAGKKARLSFWARSLGGAKVLGFHRPSGGASYTFPIAEKWEKHETEFQLGPGLAVGGFFFSLVPENKGGIQELAEGEFLLDQVSLLVWGMPEITQANVSYGPHERQKLDFWRAPGNGPSPLMVLIHGGGWLGGDKSGGSSRAQISEYHQRGISVACVNYRYSSQAPLPAPVHDAARAVQFLRSKASEWGIDKARIAASGGSAGGCSALWLATHDDLADPKSDDPVARESTRLCGAIVDGAQTTIDPVVIRKEVYETALAHQMICRAAGFPSNQAMDEGYEQARDLYREFSPINHLSADDPPILLRYVGPVTDPAEGIHSSRFGVIFKKRADEVRAPCHISIYKNPEMYPKPPEEFAFLGEILKISAGQNPAVPVK